ncbi:MAG: hypothetical protein CVV03_10575 [Firmicutes bacterium HGW-Firmicutes-8]|nr:MAG: hypothetical protein CVV03_10575 [Firmicutes bacterium HGW-Firmicutes-8]
MDNIVIKVEGDKQHAFSSLLKEMQEIVNETISEVVSHYGKKPIEISNWVAIIILKRILESSKAGEILISNEFERDAAILLTNQIELRLDMIYVSLDFNRAEEWINHTHEHRKPWKVSELFKELYSDEDEFDNEKKLYRHFSMVKHGNPVGETFSFPLAIKNGALSIPPTQDILLGKYALYNFAFSRELFITLKAAMVDFKRCGFDVSECESKADFINLMMNDLYDDNIKEQISLLMQIKPKPELCNSCSVIPEGFVEITCLLRRGNKEDIFTCDKYKSKSTD